MYIRYDYKQWINRNVCCLLSAEKTTEKVEAGWRSGGFPKQEHRCHYPTHRQRKGEWKEKGWKIIPCIMQGGRWNAKTRFLQASTCLIWKSASNSFITGKGWDIDHNTTNGNSCVFNCVVVIFDLLISSKSWHFEITLQLKQRGNRTKAKASWGPQRGSCEERLNWVNEGE